MNTADPLFHKPKSIIASKNISYATIFLGIVLLFINEINAGFDVSLKRYILLTGAIMVAVLFLITKQIGLGRKWARMAFVVFFIFEAALISFFLLRVFNSNLFINVVLIAIAVLHILVLRFLFLLKSTEWFNSVGSTITG